MTITNKILIVALFAAACARAVAATSEAIVSEILARNPELEFYRAELDAARAERRSAAKLPNPELSTTLGPKRVRSGGLSDEGIAWSIGLQQTFEWPGRVPLRKAIASRQVGLAELGFQQFTNALANRATLFVFDLFGAQQKAAAAREVADRFSQLRQVLVQRDPAGLAPELELRIIEATELTLRRDATDASLRLHSAILELNQLRGAPWTDTLTVEPVKLTFKPLPEDAALLAASQTNNFELQLRRLELAQHGLKLSLAKKDGLPAFTLGPYYSQERAGETEQQFGVALSLPIPIPGRNKSNVDAAAARERQAETALFMAERDLQRAILEQSAAYRAKVAEMDHWRPEAIDEFRKAAELADRHYRLGAVPVSSYVELQKQYLGAIDALVQTRREALAAASELRRLTGATLSARE